MCVLQQNFIEGGGKYAVSGKFQILTFGTWDSLHLITHLNTNTLSYTNRDCSIRSGTKIKDPA